MANSSRRRMLLITVGIGAALISRTSLAQEKESPDQDWQEYADSRPFPTSHIRIPKWRLTDSPHIRAAFREVVATPRLATVRVRTDGRDTALGGIVGANGWIITKASRLPGKITCLLSDERELDAKLVGIDDDYDIALLRVDASGLPALKFSDSPAPAVGAWLATVGMNRAPKAIGVVSVEPRQIEHRAGTLGVQFDVRTNRPIIEVVFPNTGAEEAGLQSEDEILSIEGRETPSRRTAIMRVREFSPGAKIKLRVLRGDQIISVTARLKGQFVGRLPTREEFQNQLGSDLSQRRAGFPIAFQHDTVVKPSDCGGPIVDLTGEVVGFNLARAGRTETYAAPADVVAQIVAKLRAAR
ncbi:MAG: trypsin-like peptidase domain-containing protein [Planctomycetota bacterium]